MRCSKGKILGPWSLSVSRIEGPGLKVVLTATEEIGFRN